MNETVAQDMLGAMREIAAARQEALGRMAHRGYCRAMGLEVEWDGLQAAEQAAWAVAAMAVESGLNLITMRGGTR